MTAAEPESETKNEPLPDAESRIDPTALREALGCFVTGVAVVTTRTQQGAPVGLTVNSFNSVSLDPPLILWSIALKAPSLAAFRHHRAFAVNILSASQADLCARFATPSPDKFSGVDWTNGYQGVPLITGALAQFECLAHARHPGGDHEIHLGRVVAMRSSDDHPLVVCRGRLSATLDL